MVVGNVCVFGDQVLPAKLVAHSILCLVAARLDDSCKKWLIVYVSGCFLLVVCFLVLGLV